MSFPADGSQSSQNGAERALAAFTFDALLAGAARLRGARIGLNWSGEAVKPGQMLFSEWDAQASACADALVDCGLAPGDCALIIAAADPASMILIFGAARAGLTVALCPAGLSPDKIAARAAVAGACAALAPGVVGEAAVADDLPEIAAAASEIRLVAAWGPTQRENDGVVRLDRADAPPRANRSHAAAPLLTFNSAGRPVRLRQASLAAATLDLIHRASLGATAPLVSPLSPARLAGLVAGPLAALCSGASLHLHAPFSATALVEALRAERDPVRLVTPGAFAEEIAGLLASAGVAPGGLIIVREAPFSPIPRPAAQDASIVDLWRWDETAVAAEPRMTGASESAPAGAHRFPLDEGDVLAFEARRSRGGYELRGVACAHGMEWAQA